MPELPSGTRIEIEEDGRVKVKYRFTFENLRDLEGNVFEPGQIAFFHRTSSTGKWQPHSEFLDGEDSGTETSRTSSAIMFVMDCSDSLGDDFPELQRVVNSLIDRLVPEGSSGIVKRIMSPVARTFMLHIIFLLTHERSRLSRISLIVASTSDILLTSIA